MVVNSHKRVLLKLPVFTLVYACIYETNSVYVQKCMSIHVGIYMYTHGTCRPLHMHVCDLDDTCNGTYTEVGELLCHDPCPQKNQRDCGLRMHASADRCPWKNISALFLALDGQLSCSAPHPSHSGSWHVMAVKTGCTPQTQEKDFCLCSPSLWTCLLVVAVSRLNGMVETCQSALGPVLLSSLLSPGGVSCLLASIPSLCSLLRKSDKSKRGFSYIVPLYKYWVYTHTDTHIYTNTDPQTKLDVWRWLATWRHIRKSSHCSCSQKVKVYAMIFKHSGKIQRIPLMKGERKMLSKWWSTD